MDTDLLRSIFLDAHVLDLDFSRWDRSVKILVVATEMPADSEKRLPVFVVDFLAVTELSVKLSHLDQPLEEGHYQWRAHSFKLSRRGEKTHLVISGSKQFPVLALTCGDIQVRTVDQRALTRSFPGWDRPGGPFVRPGIEDVLAGPGF